MFMPENWLETLEMETRSKAQKMIEQMTELGAAEPESWVRSEIEENIPQMARFLILRRLQEEISTWRNNAPLWIENTILEAERSPLTPFAEAGSALKRMIALGVSANDLGNIAEMIAFESVFGAVNIIDEGCEHTVTNEDLPCWILTETNFEGKPTGRFIHDLHESLLDK